MVVFVSADFGVLFGFTDGSTSEDSGPDGGKGKPFRSLERFEKD